MRALLVLVWTIGLACAQANRPGPAPDPGSQPWEGVVIDAVTGSPIPDATVKVCEGSNYSCWQALTDASGRFSLAFPPARVSNLRETVSKEGYVQPSPTSRASEPRVQLGHLSMATVLRLLAVATVTGDVVDARGTPMVKATVTVRSVNGLVRNETLMTDEKGHFRTQLVPASYRLCAISESEKNRFYQVPPSAVDHMPVSTCFPSGLDLKPADSVGPLRVVLAEERVFSIRGTLTTLVPRKPDWFEGIVAVPDGGGDLDYYEGTVNPRTGTISIHGLRAGWYTVIAEYVSPQYSDTAPRPPLLITTQRVRVGPRMAPLRLTLRPNATVTGQVMGEGIGESASEVYLGPDMPHSFLLYNIHYDQEAPDGRFRISDVPPGSYRVKLGGSRDVGKAFVTELRQNGKVIHGDRISVERGTTSLEVHVQKSSAFVQIVPRGNPAEWTDNLKGVVIPEDGWDRPDEWDSTISPSMFEGRLTGEWLIGPLAPGAYDVFVTMNDSAYTWEGLENEVKLHRESAVRVVVGQAGVQIVPVTPAILHPWPVY